MKEHLSTFKILFAILVFFGGAACTYNARGSSLVLKLLLGINEKKMLSMNLDKMIEIPKKYYSGVSNFGYLDSTFFSHFDRLGLDTSTRSHFRQPLNYLVFDSNNQLISTIVNCNSEDEGNFINPSWDEYLITFPPNFINSKKEKLDYEYILSHSHIVEKSTTHEPKYNVVIIWSDIMGRYKKRFLTQIARHLHEAESVSQNFSVTFLNYDYNFKQQIEFLQEKYKDSTQTQINSF